MFLHDEYEALQGGAGILDRSGRGRIRLTGGDRRTYLQGLLTNDILALAPGQGCYAAFLTPNGRMISDMRVSELGGMVLMDLPGATAADVCRRLADFIFTEDVQVEDARGALGHLGLYGPLAAAVLSRVLTPRAGDQEPAAVEEGAARMTVGQNAERNFAGTPVIVVRSDDFGVPGFELFPRADVAGDLNQALALAGALNVSAETAEVTRVEAGRPEFGPDMDEGTIPLEAGIEERAISLTKGCYVGQEIIIRVLHRAGGRVARHLVGLAGEAGSDGFNRGERVHRGDRDVGVVTSAVFSPRLQLPIALAYVHRDHVEPGIVLQAGSADASGPRRATIVALPFIPSAS